MEGRPQCHVQGDHDAGDQDGGCRWRGRRRVEEWGRCGGGSSKGEEEKEEEEEAGKKEEEGEEVKRAVALGPKQNAASAVPKEAGHLHSSFLCRLNTACTEKEYCTEKEWTSFF